MLVIPEKFVDKCIENFKETDQRQILEEECAELIQAISKNIRGKPNSIDQIKEEMTHVLISINVVARNVINTVGMWIGIKNNMSVRIDIYDVLCSK